MSVALVVRIIPRPRGHGYAVVTVANTGTVKWVATLPDGGGFTASSLIGTGNRTLVFATPHAGQSDCFLATGSLIPDAQGLRLTAEAFWMKRSQPTGKKTRDYDTGFGNLPLTLSLRGQEYRKPTGTDIVLGLAQPPNNAKITLEEGGLASTALTFNLDKAGKFTLGSDVPNPLALKLTVAPATGLITGSFTLVTISPAITRTPKLAGLIGTHPDVNAGIGHFNLAELPDASGKTKDNTPTQSGRFILFAP